MENNSFTRLRKIGAFYSEVTGLATLFFAVGIHLAQGRELAAELFDNESENILALIRAFNDYTGGIYHVRVL